MEFWQGFFTLTLVHLLAAASPGPDFALVSKQALVGGRKAGLLTSLGIALGLAVHIVYSVLGLAAIIAHSAAWMTAIRLIGGAYLVFLGIQGLRARPRHLSAELLEAAGKERSAGSNILRGFLCNTFNPKAPIYFLSLFTIVLSPDLPSRTLGIYGGWIMILQFLWFALVTLFFTQRAVRVRFLALGHWLDRIFGAAMLVLGLRVFTSGLK